MHQEATADKRAQKQAPSLRVRSLKMEGTAGREGSFTASLPPEWLRNLPSSLFPLTGWQKRFCGVRGAASAAYPQDRGLALRRSSLPLLPPRAGFLPPLSAKGPSLCSLPPENRSAEQDGPRGGLPRCQALLHRPPLRVRPQSHPSRVCRWPHRPCSLSSSRHFCTGACPRQRAHPQRA